MPYIGNPIYQSAFVTDQFSGNGSTTAFTMSVAPAGTSNVLVVVSGVVQDPSTYGVVGNTLTFSTAPPSGTGNISCRYLGVPATGVVTTAYRTVTEFTATAGQTTFTPPSYSVGYINVYRNGVRLGSADYTASNGTTVVLATGATAGDLITTESFYVSSVLNALPTSGGNITGPLNVSGSVGIGTTSPSTALTVQSSGANGAFLATDLSNANASSRLFLGYSGDTASLYYGTSGWVFGTGATVGSASGTQRLIIDPSGNVQVKTSNAGIIFNNSSATTNSTLNDYETGTWSPVFQPTGYSFTYSAQNGQYTKIGNLVTCKVYLAVSRVSGSGSSQCNISNLPFTIGSNNANYGGGCVSPDNGASFFTGPLYLRTNPNQTYVMCVTGFNGNNIGYLFTWSGMTNMEFELSFQYFATF